MVDLFFNTSMSKRKNTWNIIGISLINVIVMFFIAYYWLSLPRTFGDEAFFIKWSSLVHKSLLGFDAKPSPNEVLFVDVSGSKTTIPDQDAISFYDPDSLDQPFQRKVITDRRELTSFFQLLNRYEKEIRFVLCDILFEDETKHDSLLQKEITVLGDKMLGVSHLEYGEHLIQPSIKMPSAAATYRSSGDVFLKFPLLVGDTLKTLPVVMHERINEVQMNKKGPFYSIDKKLSLPSPIVDFKVRNSDFKIGQDLEEENFNKIPMGLILELATFNHPDSLGDFFSNKIILIGDFKTDLHNTPFGETPGLLLIYNAYLTLLYGQNEISLWWILFLCLSFFILSYRIFAEVKVMKPGWLVDVFNSRMSKYILNALDEMVLLILITILSYFLFNIHINILILFIYLKVIEWFWKKFKHFSFPSFKKKNA